MLVLGHANTTRTSSHDPSKLSIEVPPFHTGHLGFVPGTPVRIGLVAAPSGGHCEVVVTPFEQDVRYLALIEVAMRDETGVVARLIEAIAALGINIEIQESSSINLLDHHSVTLLVDLSESSISMNPEFSSPASIPESPTAVRRLYRGYDSVFPVHDLRFVLLFESIMAHCADVIVWKRVSGEYFPDIHIRPYSDRPLAKSEVNPLMRGTNSLHVEIDLPRGITSRLRRVLATGDQFEYLLVSDTSTRTLHTFFLHPDVAARLFHVGFFHDDVPGALATTLALLRDAGFSILTSLMRKLENARSVWEAVLEYQGKTPMPSLNSRSAHSPITQREVDWICAEIVAAHKRAKRKVVDCGIEVGAPKYPIRPSDAEPLLNVQLSTMLGTPNCAASTEPGYELDKLLAQQRKALEGRKLDLGVARKSTQLLELIEKRSVEGRKPGVFLSYPHSAHRHGEALKQRLSSHYRVEEYQEPDGEIIVDQVISRIEGCDYFIGIWHHEQEPAKGESITTAISPWMLFEYGVARAAEKPTIVVHSNKLDETVWKRIDQNVSNPEYIDVEFAQKTVEMIWEYCQRHFQ